MWECELRVNNEELWEDSRLNSFLFLPQRIFFL